MHRRGCSLFQMSDRCAHTAPSSASASGSDGTHWSPRPTPSTILRRMLRQPSSRTSAVRAGWSEDAEQTRRAWRDGALAGSGRAGASQVLVPAAHASILSGVRGGPTSRCLLPSGAGISCQRFSFRPCSPDSRARGKTFRRFDKNNKFGSNSHSPSFFSFRRDTVEPWLGRCSAARLPGSSPKSSLGRRRSALAFARFDSVRFAPRCLVPKQRLPSKQAPAWIPRPGGGGFVDSC